MLVQGSTGLSSIHYKHRILKNTGIEDHHREFLLTWTLVTRCADIVPAGATDTSFLVVALEYLVTLVRGPVIAFLDKEVCKGRAA